MGANQWAQTPPLKPVVMDWTDVRVRCVTYAPATVAFRHGGPGTSVLNVDDGAVRLSVVSHAGQEAVIADVPGGHVLGEGCLADLPL